MSEKNSIRKKNNNLILFTTWLIPQNVFLPASSVQAPLIFGYLLIGKIKCDTKQSFVADKEKQRKMEAKLSYA